MNILVSKVPRTLIEHFGAETYQRSLGLLVTPRTRTDQLATLADAGLHWAVDNDCFNALDKTAFVSMLKSVAGVPGCLFVSAPDVVADARATLLRFELWQPAIRHYGLPVALVAQDGLENCSFDWRDFDALFIGGTTAWKLGAAAAALAREAKERGKHIHLGRCNSNRRLRYAQAIGCDSVDGTGYAKFSRSMIPKALPVLDNIQFNLGAML